MDYVFDLAKSLEGKFSEDDFVDLIISAFKEAIRTLNFLVVFKMYHFYNLILETHQEEVTPFMI